MILIANNLTELGDSVVATGTYCNARGFPNEFKTYDEAWEELRQSIEHLKFKLGPERYPKLLKMLEQAKAHYDGAEAEAIDDARINPGEPGFEESKLGSWLMQDIELIIDGKQAAIYPKELYRW